METAADMNGKAKWLNETYAMLILTEKVAKQAESNENCQDDIFIFDVIGRTR